MEIIYKILLLFMLPLLSYSQEKTISENMDTIKINFSKKIYNNIASSSIKEIYNEQKSYLLNRDRLNNPISDIDFNDLNFISIPVFRLTREANYYYSCHKMIQNFISFNEYNNRYQETLIYYKDALICSVDIPNFEIELSRINNPGYDFTLDEEDYLNLVVKNFILSPDAYRYKVVDSILKNRKNNFFFKIFGLKDFLFEINEEGNLYLNWIGVGSTLPKHMLANDFLRNYIGESIIKEFARGYYKDIDNLETLHFKPCNKMEEIKDNIILKVIYD